MVSRSVIIGVAVALVILAGIGGFLLLPKGPPVKEFQTTMQEFGYDGYSGGPTYAVKVGDTVRFKVTNKGGAGHEFVVVADLNGTTKMFHDVITKLTNQGLSKDAAQDQYD